MNRDDNDFTSALVDDVKGMKIGLPRDYFTEGLEPEIKEAVYGVAEALKAKGAIVEEFDLGMVEYAIPAYYIIASAEASSNLERFDGVKYGYSTAEYTDLHNMYKKSTFRRIWPRGQEKNHARFICAEFRLLRCILCKGTQGKGSHQTGV